jgi:hypothetical protein
MWCCWPVTVAAAGRLWRWCGWSAVVHGRLRRAAIRMRSWARWHDGGKLGRAHLLGMHAAVGTEWRSEPWQLRHSRPWRPAVTWRGARG